VEESWLIARRSDRYAGPQFPHSIKIEATACDDDNFSDHYPNEHASPSNDDDDRESILSNLSEQHELPFEEKSLNEILKRAMKSVSEVVKRGKRATRNGLKVTYAMKIGQKKPTRTEFHNARTKKDTLATSARDGNCLSQWFTKLPKSLRSPESGHASSNSPYSEDSCGLSSGAGDNDQAMSIVSDLKDWDEQSLVDTSQSSLKTALDSPLSYDHINPSLPSISSETTGPNPPHSLDPPTTSESATTMTNTPLPDPDPESCADATLPNEGTFVPPPTLEDVCSALADIRKVLKPLRKTGKGFKDPKIDLVLHGCLKLMKMFLWQYTDDES